MRLETPKEEISYNVSPQVDQLDLHGIQLAGVENPKTVPQINVPTQAVPLSSTVHRPIHLPGLKLLNDEPTTSIGIQEPSFGCKVVETATANITSTIDQGQSARAEHAGGPELILEEKLSLEPTTVISTGESEVAESAPSIKGLPEIASPMEDVLPGVVAPEGHVAEILGETQMNEGLQEATNRISEVLVQDGIHQDGPPTSEGSHTTNTGPSTDMQAKLESRQEESVTKGVDEDKQETLMEARTVEEQLKTMEPTGSTFEEVAEANLSNNAEAEFEIDSSPYASSSSDVSTDSSSSDDSDADDYEMLSPEEEARRLMAEDGGTEEKTTTGVPRTLNEKPDEVVPKPQVTITADMKIDELGRVESLVENLVLIKANTSGEYQVLESGSVLCLEDRSVIGVIAETLGRVQQPYYAVRFSNRAAMEEAGVSQNTKVLYVTQLSKTVFTQPLKAYKGSDASNLHDEEVGDDELEFSDDEAEAEHRRQVKLHKRARYDAKHGQENGASGVSQPRLGMPKNLQNGYLNAWRERPPNPTELSLNYDDAGQDSDDPYTPLARPSNLHEMRAGEDVPSGNHANFGNTNRGGRGKGRGDRGRGRGDRGRGRDRGRGNDRGGRPDRRGPDSLRGIGHPHAHPNIGQKSSPISQSNGFNASANNHLPPRPPDQTNDFQSHPQTQHLPVQPPFYPAHSSAQPHSHPNHAHHYPPQYPQSYSQPYTQQHQQPHNHYQDPYFHSIPGQGYNSQQAFSPGSQYPIMHIPPSTPSTAAIPPGAHINPNFFRQQAQSSPQPWYHQQRQAFSPAQQHQQYQQPAPANGNAAAPGGMPQEAARTLQGNLNMLQGSGPHGSSSR